jgi:hypothetical protein
VLQDGSLVASKATVTGEVNATKGTFRNVAVNGSLRSQFALVDDSFNAPYNDNVVIESGGGTKIFTLSWTVDNSGRRITLINYKWESQVSQGGVQVSAPSGKYFYENGKAVDLLKFSREAVELIGYGDSATFYGWIVLNRTDLMTESKRGSLQKVLAQGTVIVSKPANVPIAKITYKTYDNSTMSVNRLGVGQYQVLHTIGNSNYTVMLTGFFSTVDNTEIWGTIYNIASNSFTIWTQDDTTQNDGSFNFQIISTVDWAS